MFERGLRSICELISIILCLPILAVLMLGSVAHQHRTVYLNRSARITRPVRPGLQAQVGEFDSVHAVAAYEKLIDTVCQERVR